jgi:hypothetical protein
MNHHSWRLFCDITGFLAKESQKLQNYFPNFQKEEIQSEKTGFCIDTNGFRHSNYSLSWS